MNSLDTDWQMALEQRARQGGLRELRDWRLREAYVDFSSNDYLGLSRHPLLRERSLQALQSPASLEGMGSTGSRLLTGHWALMEQVEGRVSSFHRAEAGLIFNSGYDANLGLISCLMQEGDVLVYDEFVHASIRDGAKLAGVERFPFRHNDVEHLATRLQNLRQRPKLKRLFVAVESVYSMDGDVAPLREMGQLCRQYQAHLIVDEAHATGVLGESGRGLVVQEQMQDQVLARVHTFGKALGTHGAIVLGSRVLKQYLINFARSFIYTTALPPHAFRAIEMAYQLLEQDPRPREQLLQNIASFQRLAQEFLPPTMRDWRTPIFPLGTQLGRERLIQVQAELRQQGLHVSQVMSPTVPRGKERLRVCLHAYNTIEEMQSLVAVLGKWAKAGPL